MRIIFCKVFWGVHWMLIWYYLKNNIILVHIQRVTQSASSDCCMFFVPTSMHWNKFTLRLWGKGFVKTSSLHWPSCRLLEYGVSQKKKRHWKLKVQKWQCRLSQGMSMSVSTNLYEAILIQWLFQLTHWCLKKKWKREGFIRSESVMQCECVALKFIVNQTFSCWAYWPNGFLRGTLTTKLFSSLKWNRGINMITCQMVSLTFSFSYYCFPSDHEENTIHFIPAISEWICYLSVDFFPYDLLYYCICMHRRGAYKFHFTSCQHVKKSVMMISFWHSLFPL